MARERFSSPVVAIVRLYGDARVDGNAETILAVGFKTFTEAVEKSDGWEIGDSPVKTRNYPSVDFQKRA